MDQDLQNISKILQPNLSTFQKLLSTSSTIIIFKDF